MLNAQVVGVKVMLWPIAGEHVKENVTMGNQLGMDGVEAVILWQSNVVFAQAVQISHPAKNVVKIIIVVVVRVAVAGGCVALLIVVEHVIKHIVQDT